MIRAVLFDYGGTLVRQERPWNETKAKAIRSGYNSLKSNGLKLPYVKYQELNGAIFQKYSQLEAKTERDIPDIVKYQDIVDIIFPNRPKSWRVKVAAQANAAFWATVTQNLVPRENAAESLARLKSMNLQLAVVSNHHNRESLVGHLGSLRLSSYFSAVLASSQMRFRKPDPRIFERCLSLLKARGHEAIYVGDSPEYDSKGAKMAGMRSILVVDDLAGAHTSGPISSDSDFVIRDLNEIPGIVSSL